MAKNKTVETSESVDAYLMAIADPKRREDCQKLTRLFEEVTGFEPKMWGAAIIGFGSYHYKYQSGHEGDAPLAGLSSRANAITLYLLYDFPDKDDLLQKLGKHKASKACVYIKKWEDIDVQVLTDLIRQSVTYLQTLYPG